jgi:hypothetical protein
MQTQSLSPSTTAAIAPACCAGADHGKTRSQPRSIGRACGNGLAFTPGTIGVGAVAFTVSEPEPKLITYANAFAVSIAIAKPHIDAKHECAAGGRACDRLGRRVD